MKNPSDSGDARPSPGRFRPFVQAAFFAAACFAVLETVFPLPDWNPNLLVRFSPLLALTTFLSGGIVSFFLPSLLLILSALVAGRVFCGWACPVGAFLDLWDTALRRFLRIRRLRRPQRLDAHSLPRTFKFFILALVLLAAAFGIGLAGWFDPLSLFVRTTTNVFLPGLDHLLFLLHKNPLTGRTFSFADEFFRRRFLLEEPFPLHDTFLVAAFFLFVLLLSFLGSRAWCRFVCPLGALLGLLSPKPRYRRLVYSDLCTECGRCTVKCPPRAIARSGRTTEAPECLLCMECGTECPENAIRYSPASERDEPLLDPKRNVALTRRGLFAGTIAGFVIGPLLKPSSDENPGVIRPPGVASEREFLSRCIRCAECVRVCPSAGLRPTGFETGLSGLWAPRLVPRTGYCEYTCNDCGKVCPTGAIPNLSLVEKQKAVLGLARIDKHRCIPWHEGEPCVVCEEFCPTPTKAIKLSHEKITVKGTVKAVRAPKVVEKDCIGCGICETMCPVDGPAAIRIFPSPHPSEKPVRHESARSTAAAHRDFRTGFDHQPPASACKIS